MAESVREVLKMCGIADERFSLEWASAAEGPRFVQLITDYCMKIKSMGSLGSAEGEEPLDVIKERLDKAIKAASNTKVRTSFGMVAKGLNKANSYDAPAIKEAVAKKVVPAFEKAIG